MLLCPWMQRVKELLLVSLVLELMMSTEWVCPYFLPSFIPLILWRPLENIGEYNIMLYSGNIGF